ncbi:hypothetical protein MOF8_10040 [Methylobacterium oryzae]
MRPERQAVPVRDRFPQRAPEPRGAARRRGRRPRRGGGACPRRAGVTVLDTFKSGTPDLSSACQYDTFEPIKGDALDAAPLAGIGEAARTALQHLRGVPHLVVRVHDSLVEEAETLVKRLARERGYEGRLVVLGDPDMAAGDARIEWADGGIVRERARIEAAVLDALGLPTSP